MRPLGLAALTVLELPHHEQVAVAAQCGYTHVGLRLAPVAGQPFMHALSLPEIAARLAGTGVRLLDVEVFRLGPQVDFDEFKPVLEAAGRLGASEILVHGADADEARLVERFGRLCDLAAPYGLHANLEPMPWVDTWSIAKALRVIEGAARDNGALLVDAIHFSRAGEKLAALRALPRSRLRYAQLCDAPAEVPADMPEIIRQARGDRLPPGEGALDLRGLLAALPPDLPLSLEVPLARSLPAAERARIVREATLKLLGA